MRQTLIRVLLNEPWVLWKPDQMTGLDGMGVCLLLLCAGLIGFSIQYWRWRRTMVAPENRPGRFLARHWESLALWLGSLLLLTFLGPWLPDVLPQVRLTPSSDPIPRTSFPVWGYGFMLLIGFVLALKFAERRADQEGISREQLFDLAFWILICGIAGARTFYLLQYGHEVFRDTHGIAATVGAALNLSQGGIVLYGGLLAGAAAYFAFCYKRGLSPLRVADVLTPSVFIGVGFGRLGCFLNGCCYGDRCELPWAVQFPRNSLTWNVLLNEGFLDQSSQWTMPLHPTQIYSSINAFLLAWVTATYFRHRRRPGEVFALALILYPLTRFTIEFIRGDELGQFGTGLTISQIVSLGLLATGLILLAWLSFGGDGHRSPPTLAKVSRRGT